LPLFKIVGFNSENGCLICVDWSMPAQVAEIIIKLTSPTVLMTATVFAVKISWAIWGLMMLTWWAELGGGKGKVGESTDDVHISVEKGYGGDGCC
jgi:hypothetical protein